MWVPGNGVKDQPRVLLIGDSITRAYYKTVEDKLKGKAVVCRLTTSKSLDNPGLLDEVKLMKARNKAAGEIMAKEKIPTNDLFALVADKPELFSNDGVHMNAKGSTVLGEQVAAEVFKLLGDGKK